MKDKQKYRKQMPEDTKAVIGLFIIVIVLIIVGSLLAWGFK